MKPNKLEASGEDNHAFHGIKASLAALMAFVYAEFGSAALRRQSFSSLRAS